MNTLKNINSDFSVYTGTENYYRHLFGGLFTDGVRAVAEELHAYWLIDAIFSYLPVRQAGNRKEEFQIWTLEVKDSQGVLTMKEDSNRPSIVRQDIPFTDFPEGIFKMYFTNGVLLLPSEY